MANSYSPIKPLTSTYNINNNAGWNTRHIYNYYGSPAGIYDYYVDTGAYTFDLFAAIQNYTFSSTDEQPLYKAGNGQLQFLSRYFATGKSLRIKGRFLITNRANAAFNMWVSCFDYGTTTTTIIASTNNGSSHRMPDVLTDVPVDYEITITSLESKITKVSVDSNTLFLQANGHYQYESGNYGQTGPNNQPIYVPIWNRDQYVETGLITESKAISLTFNDSSAVDNIKVMYMTVEELE